MADAALERVLRRDRIVLLAALAAITLLAWGYVLHLAGQMDMGGMDMTGFRMTVSAAGMVMTPGFQAWSVAEFAFTLAMWVVMMIGMMTPSVAPILLLYARVGRQAAEQGKPFAATGWFAAGYFVAWTGFAAVFTVAQWALDRIALLTPTMASASTLLGGLVWIAAGAYQWTSIKYRCLSHCQSPLQFVQHHGGFRSRPLDSLRLGMQHGAYCVGCCWALMALLFVGGVMNVLWIAAITILVLAEKAVVAGRVIPRIVGIAFAGAGVWMWVG